MFSARLVASSFVRRPPGAPAGKGSRRGRPAACARAGPELRVLVGVPHHLRPERGLPGEEGGRRKKCRQGAMYDEINGHEAFVILYLNCCLRCGVGLTWPDVSLVRRLACFLYKSSRVRGEFAVGRSTTSVLSIVNFMKSTALTFIHHERARAPIDQRPRLTTNAASFPSCLPSPGRQFESPAGPRSHEGVVLDCHGRGWRSRLRGEDRSLLPHPAPGGLGRARRRRRGSRRRG